MTVKQVTMALTASTDLLQRHLSDWQIQFQIWAATGKVVRAATERLLMDTVPASLKDLNGRLAVDDWSDIPRFELLSESGMGGAIGAAWAESSVVNINGTASSRNESKENFAVGSISNALVSLLITGEFSSTIFNNPQPVIRCGCSTCMQQTRSFDKNLKIKPNKQWSVLPHNPGTLVSTDTWSVLPDSNPYINGLMTGSKWGTLDPDSSTKVVLDYYFFEDETLPDGAFGYKFTQEETDAAINAMTAYSNVANISFTQNLNFDEANISWASLNSTDSGDGILGYAYTPESGDLSGITTVNWENYFNDQGVIQGSIDPGSYYYLTFTHELGHALGLKHPHDLNYPYDVFPGVRNSADGGDNGLNAGPWTVMTYNNKTSNNGVSPSTDSYSGFLTGLGAFDIAAVQYLYGANLGTNTGNDIYTMSDQNGFSCIWDNGGVDTISAFGMTSSVTIDLRNATLINETGGGGYVSQTGNAFKGYTIAYNSTGSCIIENATGGSAADILKGNSVANIMRGQNGNDFIDAGGGNDLIRAGNGRDIITGGSGADELHGDFGWNTYRDERDRSPDLIVIKSDHFLVNWLYGQAGNNPNGEKADIIEGLDPIDRIRIKGVTAEEITFASGVSNEGVTGIGIYGKGALEAVYIGDDLSVAQLTNMTSGDASVAAMNNQIASYGWTANPGTFSPQLFG